MEPKPISGPNAFANFKALLSKSGLPHKDLDMDRHLLFGYYENENLIGTGGLEIYGSFGLLRSVCIGKNYHGKKLGTQIATHLIGKAKGLNLKGVYLLTETATGFFQKLGFKIIDRSLVTGEVKASAEFDQVCPTTAVCMYLSIGET